MGLPGSEDSLTIGWAILTQYQRVTDGRTDGRTSSLFIIAITCFSMADARKTQKCKNVALYCVIVHSPRKIDYHWQSRNRSQNHKSRIVPRDKQPTTKISCRILYVNRWKKRYAHTSFRNWTSEVRYEFLHDFLCTGALLITAGLVDWIRYAFQPDRHAGDSVLECLHYSQQ